MGYSEECGVVACSLKNLKIPLVPVLQSLLQEVQHRGQTSTGISTYSKDSQKRLKSFSDAGNVSNFFKIWDRPFYNNLLNRYAGEIGTGHVRYATSNVSEDMNLILEEAQPFLRRHGRPWKKFSIAFNGHLSNYNELKKGLLNEGYLLDTNVDTEVLMHLISLSLKNGSVNSVDDVFNIFEDVVKKLDGSFCFVFLNAVGDLVVARDFLGFRPLVIGENEDMICVASESRALTKVGIINFRDIKPGEIVVIRDGKIYSKLFKKDSKTAHCHFEHVYFSDACSVSDGLVVDEVRARLGKILGREEKLKSRFSEGDFVVIPIPSTSIPCAVSYSQETKLPISFSLIKGDVGRGFINSSTVRKNIMDSKYNLVPESVRGKKVILVDDSVVRGETSSRIVKMVRSCGAKEVHLRVSEMPIRYPCCYGVDFPSFEELIVGNFKGTVLEAEKFVAEKIGADSMGFVSFEGMKEALRGDENKFCFACLTGNYPTCAGQNFLECKSCAAR